MPTECPSCGRPFGPGLILAGWRPCHCGGHRTTWCRDDNGGCGAELFEPPLAEGCAEVHQGFGP